MSKLTSWLSDKKVFWGSVLFMIIIAISAFFVSEKYPKTLPLFESIISQTGTLLITQVILPLAIGIPLFLIFATLRGFYINRDRGVADIEARIEGNKVRFGYKEAERLDPIYLKNAFIFLQYLTFTIIVFMLIKCLSNNEELSIKYLLNLISGLIDKKIDLNAILVIQAKTQQMKILSLSIQCVTLITISILLTFLTHTHDVLKETVTQLYWGILVGAGLVFLGAIAFVLLYTPA